MITVNKFNEICQQIVEEIEISGYVLCSTEEQGMKKLKDKAGINLVAVYPNYSLSGEQDNYKYNHELLFYMVIRQKEGASDLVEIQQYQNTQEAIVKLKEFLFGEDEENFSYCQMFPDMDIRSVNIIPEYNVFGGYLGWSMVLEA